MASFLEIFRAIFGGSAEQQQQQPQPQSPGRAEAIMRRFNPNGLIGFENGYCCMIEDAIDPDGRIFRLEYQSTPDGRHAVAWCRWNPWGSVAEIHTMDGLICIGPGHHGPTVQDSAFSLEYVIPRARFWCTAVSVFHESGHFPNL